MLVVLTATLRPKACTIVAAAAAEAEAAEAEAAEAEAAEAEAGSSRHGVYDTTHTRINETPGKVHGEPPYDSTLQ